MVLNHSLQLSAATLEERNKTISQLIAFSSGIAFVTLNKPDTITTKNCGPDLRVKVEIETAEKRVAYSTLLAAKTANQPVDIMYDDHENSTECTLIQVNLLNF